jgi:UDP-N-acetylmuramoylalanine--D-glutamate ligase
MIVGMARSGVASAKLLSQNGWRIVLNDTREQIEGLRQALEGVSYTAALGEDPIRLLDGVCMLVLSPGVSMFQPFVEEARSRGIEVIGETELGYRYAKAEFVCITGTNGKTTCTALAGEVVKRTGRHTFVLGNIGTPITEQADQTRPGDIVVAETAALQLEGNEKFHAHVAAVTNVTEDHLDRFLTMDYYIACKKKIFLNQTREDYAILNYDDPITRGMAGDTRAQALYFSRKAIPAQGVYLRDGIIKYSWRGREGVLFPAHKLLIPGAHNIENAMLAAAVGLVEGVADTDIADVLTRFAGVEHRIEYVCEKKGVRYFNDSKGTNPDSTFMAVTAMSAPTVLILGGYDKHSSFDKLFAYIKQSNKIKDVVILGETADKLKDAAREAGFSAVHLSERGFRDAVVMARDLTRPGDAVLLSPACASWDMFENFEERGRVFKTIVNGFEG